MAHQIERTVAVGIFDRRTDAEQAVTQFREAGFSDEQIGFLHHTQDAGIATDPATVEPKTTGAATVGAVAGGVTGGIAGALLAGLIPGIGPVVAAGILAGALGGATLGAAGGVVRTLLDLGVPEEESRLYEQQFGVGRTILAVKAAGRHDEAVGILRRAGATFVRAEESPERGEQYSPGDPAAVPETGAVPEDDRDATDTEDVAMNSYAASGEGSPRNTYGERSTGELGGEDITGTSVDDAISGSGAVRTGLGESFGEATTGGGTERPGSLGGGETGMGAPGSTHDVGVWGPGSAGEARTRFERWQDIGPRFDAQWRERHGGGDVPEDQEPALRFGWERATAPERQADHWIDAEPMLRHDWEAEYPDTPWENVADLVRQGWESAEATSEADVGISDSASGSPIDRGQAA